MKEIPGPSRRRLVLLERLLCGYKESYITSQKIQELTSWSAAVVRRDISLLDGNFGSSNGYKVQELCQAVKLAINSPGLEQKCCIVGLGRMGQLLMDSTELDKSPYTLVAGFDSSVNRTEVLRSTFPLHPTTMLEQVIRAEHIDFALLTVQASEAQSIAERLCAAGIRGIVNYTPCVLTVPPQVAVENVGLLTALENLSAECIASEQTAKE